MKTSITNQVSLANPQVNLKPWIRLKKFQLLSLFKAINQADEILLQKTLSEVDDQQIKVCVYRCFNKVTKEKKNNKELMKIGKRLIERCGKMEGVDSSILAQFQQDYWRLIGVHCKVSKVRRSSWNKTESHPVKQYSMTVEKVILENQHMSVIERIVKNLAKTSVKQLRVRDKYKAYLIDSSIQRQLVKLQHLTTLQYQKCNMWVGPDLADMIDLSFLAQNLSPNLQELIIPDSSSLTKCIGIIAKRCPLLKILDLGARRNLQLEELKQVSCLRHLESIKIFGEVKGVVEQLSKLTELHSISLCLRNQMIEVPILDQLLNLRQIKSLAFDIWFDKSCEQQVHVKFLKVLEKNKSTLKKISFSMCMVRNSVIETLSKAGNVLEELSILETRNDQRQKIDMNLIWSMTHLKILKIKIRSSQILQPKQIIQKNFAEGLLKLGNLEDLSLQGIAEAINDEVLVSISKLKNLRRLKYPPTLRGFFQKAAQDPISLESFMKLKELQHLQWVFCGNFNPRLVVKSEQA